MREHWTSKLGDYDPETMMIRAWMRTAIREEVTSFGTLLSTLCHEFCHHLDFQKFGFRDSWHTRGFYERAGALYHYARDTAPKRLFWVPVAGGRWRIDWPRTNRGVWHQSRETRQPFVLYVPERQVDAWLCHIGLFGHFMLEVLLRVASHN